MEDSESLFQLGIKAAEQNDLAAAAGFYRKAAENGHIDAIFEWGVCLLFGDGVAQDVPQGLALLRRAADAGQKTALAMLLQYDLTETPEDPQAQEFVLQHLPETINIFKQLPPAAVLPYLEPLKELAIADENALFCVLRFYMEQGPQQTVACLQELTDRGSQGARYHLGMCYMDGTLVEKDEARAVELLKVLPGADSALNDGKKD